MAAYEGRHERRYTAFAYGIHGTPTTIALAEAMAELSGGARTLLLSSGLSAVTQALTAFLRRDDHLLIADSVYGPTRVFCTQVLARYGVEVTSTIPGPGRASPDSSVRTRGSCTSSPRVADVRGPGRSRDRRGRAPRGALVLLDNTWATPLTSGRSSTAWTSRIRR